MRIAQLHENALFEFTICDFTNLGQKQIVEMAHTIARNEEERIGTSDYTIMLSERPWYDTKDRAYIYRFGVYENSH